MIRKIKRPIVMIDVTGKFLKKFTTKQDINEYFNKKYAYDTIKRACEGRNGLIYNHFWLFEEDYLTKKSNKIYKSWVKEMKEKYIKKNILMIDSKGNVLKKFSYVKDANIYLGKEKRDNSISRACRGLLRNSYGYLWLYEDDYAMKIKDNTYEIWLNNVTIDNKKIVMINKSGNVEKIFDNLSKAAFSTGDINNRSNISVACKNKYSLIYNYFWLTKIEYDKMIKTNKYNQWFDEVKNLHNLQKILMIDNNGEIVKHFNDIKEVNLYLNKKENNYSIIKKCKDKKGKAYDYFWLFEDDYNEMIKTNTYSSWLKNTIKKDKVIVMIDMNGIVVKTFTNKKEISTTLDNPYAYSNVIKVCNKKCLSVYNHLWLFEEDYIKLINDNTYDSWFNQIKKIKNK